MWQNVIRKTIPKKKTDLANLALSLSIYNCFLNSCQKYAVNFKNHIFNNFWHFFWQLFHFCWKSDCPILTINLKPTFRTISCLVPENKEQTHMYTSTRMHILQCMHACTYKGEFIGPEPPEVGGSTN